MRDFSNYAEQGLQIGKTVPYEVTELVNADGTHPIVHAEHLGSANVSLTEEALAKAGSPQEPEEKTPLEREQSNREYIARHAARRIEHVFFSDGTPATDADIIGFIRSLPTQAFARLAAYVMDEGNFCKRPTIATKPSELAEK